MPIKQMGNRDPGKGQALPKVLMPESGLEPRAMASQSSPLSAASSEVVFWYSTWRRVQLSPGKHSGTVTLAWNCLLVSLPPLADYELLGQGLMGQCQAQLRSVTIYE